MKLTHVELIDPQEKLSGYVGPKEPATALDLRCNAFDSAQKWPELDKVVWKVLRVSVNWKRHATSRRIRVGDRVLPCEVIGSVRDWWFVSLNANQAARMLTDG